MIEDIRTCDGANSNTEQTTKYNNPTNAATIPQSYYHKT